MPKDEKWGRLPVRFVPALHDLDEAMAMAITGRLSMQHLWEIVWEVGKEIEGSESAVKVMQKRMKYWDSVCGELDEGSWGWRK